MARSSINARTGEPEGFEHEVDVALLDEGMAEDLDTIEHDVKAAFARNGDKVKRIRKLKQYFKPGGQGGSSTDQNKLQTELQKELPYTICHKNGHWPSQCPLRLKGEGKGKTKRVAAHVVSLDNGAVSSSSLSGFAALVAEVRLTAGHMSSLDIITKLMYFLC